MSLTFITESLAELQVTTEKEEECELGSGCGKDASHQSLIVMLQWMIIKNTQILTKTFLRSNEFTHGLIQTHFLSIEFKVENYAEIRTVKSCEIFWKYFAKNILHIFVRFFAHSFLHILHSGKLVCTTTVSSKLTKVIWMLKCKMFPNDNLAAATVEAVVITWLYIVVVSKECRYRIFSLSKRDI